MITEHLSICAFSAICEEDRIWIPNYLAEVGRLRMPFVMYFDRCSEETTERVQASPWYRGSVSQLDPAIEFTETAKQWVFDLLVDFRQFKWAMAWDVDEMFERTAPEKLARIAALDCDLVQCSWVNLWDDPQHIRVDGPFSSGRRVKFYNLLRRKWKFDNPITNGAKACDGKGRILGHEAKIEQVQDDLVCLHWGMMTRELRELHKERWDRIYSKALRGDKNPYKFWDFSLNETEFPPEILLNPYM